MEEDRIRDLSELPDLSKMKPERGGLPKNWAFSKGHVGLERDQWAIINVQEEDLSADVYPLPMCVSVLVNWERANERETLQRDLKNLLGVDD